METAQMYFPLPSTPILNKARDPPPDDDVVHTPSIYRTLHKDNATRERLFSPRVYSTTHPIMGEVNVDPTNGKVYGPPFSEYLQQAGLREVPLRPYKCGNTRKNRDERPPIPFSTCGRRGVRLVRAYAGEFSGIDERDSFPFSEKCRGITVRMHFPGYLSSTDLERELKKYSDRTNAKSMQLSTKNFKQDAGPVTKSKLAQEVSKRIKWHIADLEANSDLFPFDSRVGEEWRLGQGTMKFGHMTITELINISNGSWSPVICIDRDPIAPATYPTSGSAYDE